MDLFIVITHGTWQNDIWLYDSLDDTSRFTVNHRIWHLMQANFKQNHNTESLYLAEQTDWAA